MWGVNLKHKEKSTFRLNERGQVLARIEKILTEKKFKDVQVTNYLITAKRSTPFLLSVFGGLNHTAYYTISLTEQGDLNIECSIPKGPGTDWGFCKKEVFILLELIDS